MKGWLLGASMLVLGSPRVAEARPRHEGFTGDLGIGISLTLVPHRYDSQNCVIGDTFTCTESSKTTLSTEFGLAPLSLSLGGFVTPKVAILGRAAGTSYFHSGYQIVNNFYGAIVEFWPIDAFYVSGGVGYGLYGKNPLFSSSANLESGLVLDIRVGLALAQGTNHDFTLSLEAIPGFYDSEIVNGFALVGAWKWY